MYVFIASLLALLKLGDLLDEAVDCGSQDHAHAARCCELLLLRVQFHVEAKNRALAVDRDVDVFGRNVADTNACSLNE
jgi:hypothetical protein